MRMIADLKMGVLHKWNIDVFDKTEATDREKTTDRGPWPWFVHFESLLTSLEIRMSILFLTL